MRVEDGDILEDVPWQADELRDDKADDGKHGNAPVLDVSSESTAMNAPVSPSTASMHQASKIVLVGFFENITWIRPIKTLR